uniref:Vigilin n=1 Tax=Hirondellea gigas TaxID=1518452 RepID=A0A2P2HWJ6_9CRUS
MDQTRMQQTVMDLHEDVACSALQPPLESVAVTADNTTAPPAPLVDATAALSLTDDATAAAAPPPAAAAAAPVVAAPTYDELFPALGPGLTPSGVQNPSTATTADSGGWSAAARNSNDAMRIQTSVITQVFHVRQEERAKIDGGNQFGESASSSICTDITKRTNAHIEISSAKDHSLTFLVTGKPDAVAKARKLVLEKFLAQNRTTINIPKEHHKFLLGKKGKKLQELELNTSTKIQVPGVNDPSDQVTIVGTKDCIEKALHEIRIVSDEQSKQANEVVDILKKYHPFVCGGNNSIINKMMAAYGVRINVPPISVMKDEISVTGDKEGVLKVKEFIIKTQKELERNSQTVCVEVPKLQHKYIIGQKGCNISEILDQHGVSVEMPPQDSDSITITLRGPQSKLGGALTMVYDMANSMVQSEVNAPAWLHRYIIGRKGANINKITAEFPLVHVEFTDKGESIKLEGPRDDVEKARDNLETMIAEMLSRLKQDQITVDSKYHKHIIGKSGANINRIRQDTNVIINIEPNGSDIIRLEGRPEDVAQVKKELLELVHKLENEKERELVIEHRLHRNIIGQRGERIREIKDQFNQVQISLPDPGQKSDLVKVRGPKEDVDACCKYLQKMVKELMETNYQIKVAIFKEFLKFIIGKSGANINKIRSETDTRIELSTNDQNNDEILIIGRKENCEKAKERIQQIQDELANIIDVVIIVPAKFHTSIIGQRGRLIRSISEECGGVHIKFPPPDKKSDKVTIRGPKEDVYKAKSILVELSNERQLSSCLGEVRCKVQHHKFLIGKNGATIRKLRDLTGARIIFPTDKDDDKEIITIIGKEDQVAKARTSLEATIRELDHIVEGFVTVPMKHHMHFIQRRGDVIRQIGDMFGGVNISFPRNGQNSDQVTLKGGAECVAGAKGRILEIVSELDCQISMDVVIPQRQHRTVMGPRGSCIQNIIATHNVEIKFPERATAEEAQRRDEEPYNEGEIRACDIVRLRGSPENCEAAKTALLDLLPITREMTVPFKFHRYVIGQRGQSVRALMTTHDVNIQIPPAANQSDIIKILGLSMNVEGAYQALEEQVGKLEAEELDRQARSYYITINVDPEYHPKIIGRKGAVVSKIRDKHGVNIQFPQKTDEDPTAITITGYEKNCEEAKESIMAITGDLASQIKMSFDIDNRVHARLIGQRGRAIRKVMDDYKVSISFPRSDDTPDLVTISGAEANVNECKEHLLNLAEEYMQDILDREDMNYYAAGRPPPLQFGAFDVSAGDAPPAPDVAVEGQQREGETQQPAEIKWGGVEESSTAVPLVKQAKLTQNGNAHLSNGALSNKQGFVMTGAPWAQEAPNMNSSEDFPSMGASPSAPVVSPWGPKR